MNLSTNVQFLLEAQIQFKILHWQTKGYSRHIAFGKIYSSMGKNIDSFVEVAMGKYGRFTLSENERTLNLQNLSELDLTVFLKTLKSNIIGIANGLSQEKDTDLLNIKDEILADVNKLSYLLTLE
jgi:DNA-binding ferritin-like protein